MRIGLMHRIIYLCLCAAGFVAGAAVLLTPCLRAQEPVQGQPNIRVTVDRVNVGVVVTDSHGQFVQGLQRTDFRIFDDGVEQPITDFLNIDEPAQVFLLVEAGPAVYFLQGGHLQAVQTLLDGLSGGDRVAIARYDDRASLVLDFIGDKRVAAGMLDQLHFNLGFGQLNLASSLLTALDWLARVPGKKSIVLLTTGLDTSPADVLQNLLTRLKTTDVRVLSVSLIEQARESRPPESKSSKRSVTPDEKAQFVAEGLTQAHQELTAIAEANASRAYFPASANDFAQTFAEISQVIRHEYSLGFSPPIQDARVHSIEVAVRRFRIAPSDASGDAAYRVYHRKAYLAPAPEHE